MIELFSANTPNGWKISIMLEEIGYEYKVTKVDITKDDQFKPEFIKISPFGKIPVIIDHENNKSIFESGAILIYLAEKSGKLYNEKDRLVINQWLMAQMGTVGPMIGQHHQFHHYNPGKSEFGEERYFKITKRIYGELDNRLKETKYLYTGDLGEKTPKGLIYIIGRQKKIIKLFGLRIEIAILEKILRGKKIDCIVSGGDEMIKVETNKSNFKKKKKITYKDSCKNCKTN